MYGVLLECCLLTCLLLDRTATVPAHPDQTPSFGPADRGGATGVVLRTLTVEAFAICDGPEPERAGRANSCPRGPTCPNRAYLTVLYPTLALAEQALDDHARALSRRILPGRERRLTADQPLVLRIARVRVEDMRARDYRRRPCGILHTVEDLREGTGEEPAWQELRRQREHEQADGALLRGPIGTSGMLFLFLTAERKLRLDSVDRIAWRHDA
jgi:hypothetical protein